MTEQQITIFSVLLGAALALLGTGAGLAGWKHRFLIAVLLGSGFILLAISGYLAATELGPQDVAGFGKALLANQWFDGSAAGAVGLIVGMWLDRTVRRPKARERHLKVEAWFVPALAVMAFCPEHLVAEREGVVAERESAWDRMQAISVQIAGYAGPLPTLEYDALVESGKDARRDWDKLVSSANVLMVILHIHLCTMLDRGELVARGFRNPITHDSLPQYIPREQWRLLKFATEYSDTAEAHDVQYLKVQVGKPTPKLHAILLGFFRNMAWRLRMIAIPQDDAS